MEVLTMDAQTREMCRAAGIEVRSGTQEEADALPITMFFGPGPGKSGHGAPEPQPTQGQDLKKRRKKKGV